VMEGIDAGSIPIARSSNFKGLGNYPNPSFISRAQMGHLIMSNEYF